MKKTFIFIGLFLHCIFSFSQSIQALTKAAERGDIKAQIFLGDAYFEGRYGVERNINESYKWYMAAAEQNNAEAQYKVAKFYYKLNGTWGDEEDVKRAYSYMKKSADNGNVFAQLLLGDLIIAFQLDDYKEAVAYYQKALEQFHPIAALKLGHCHYYGLGVDRDFTKDQNCFHMASLASAHYPGLMSETNLWMGYCARETGDYGKAKEYFQVVINAGVPQGYNDMAYLYAEGKGVSKNFNEAHRLVDIAIEKEPKFPNFYDSKGEFYLMEGKMDKAREMWEKVLMLDPNAEQRTDPLALAMMNSIDNNIPESSLKSEKTFALIIANEDYKRVTPVPFAKNDGNIFAKYCKKTLGVPEKNVYFVENATLGDIKYHINLIKKIADAFNGEARIIFYYAGHGIPDEAQKTSYLLPVDGYGNDATSGYSLESLYAELASIPAKSTLVFMDACFSGAQRDGSMMVEARGVAIKPKEEMPTGKLIVFSAAQGDETAFPYTEKKHGMFTYYLLKKLQDTKGDTTLGELMNYVTTEVKQQSVLQNRKSQTPKVTASQAIADSWQNMKLK